MSMNNSLVDLNAARDMRSQDTNIINMSPQFELAALRQKVMELESRLNAERAAKLEVELELRETVADRNANWKQEMSQEERNRIRAEELAAFQKRIATGLTSDGRPLPRPADSFRSYTEMTQFLETLKHTGRLGIRNWALMRCGICFGLRVSDMLRLRWNWLKNPDGTWRDRLPIVEKKTSKINRILITDAIKETLDEYAHWLGSYNPNGLIFCKTTGAALNTKVAARIFTEINETVGLPIHISSHTMRKTFANIILSCYDGTMQVEAIDKAQRALNHADQRSTGHYLAVIDAEVDKARVAVSDFMLGKTDIDKLGVPKMKTNNELYAAIEEMRRQIAEMKGETTTW